MKARGFHPSLWQVDTSTPPCAPAVNYNMNSAPVAHMLTSRPASSARCRSVHFQHLAGHRFAHPLQSHLPGFNSSLGCCEWAKLTPHCLYYKHTNPASYTSSCVSLLTHSPTSKSSGHWASVCRTDGHGPDKTLGSKIRSTHHMDNAARCQPNCPCSFLIFLLLLQDAILY